MKYSNFGERLLENVDIDPETGCYLWKCHRQNNGYGRINMRTPTGHRSLMVHRVAFEYFHRPLLPGEEVDHICFNRACINPNHLRAVSKQTNLANRRYGKV